MEEAFDALGRGDLWGALERTLGAALAGFYAVVPVYGVSIILLTVAVRLLLWPLISKQTRSMMAMQRVQPEIKRLQQKYKGDRQRLNEELMKFYQEHKINPLAGCLPLLVQMPIMFALFRVFSTPPGSQGLLSAVSQRATSGALMCDGAVPRGIHGLIPSDSALRQSLDCGVQSFLAMDLAKRPADFIKIFPDVVPYLILVALVVVTGFWQGHQSQSRMPAGAQNDQMRMIMKIMPIFLGFVTYTLSAGLGVYFLVGNLWQIGQQQMIFRQRERDEAAAKDRKRAAPVPAAVGGDGPPERTTRRRPTTVTPPAPDPDEGKRTGTAAERPTGNGSRVGSRPAAAQRKKKRRKKGR